MFFKNKSKDESIAVIDIGSGNVGAGIVSLSKKRAPKVVYSNRSPIVFQEKLDYEMFRRSMFTSLENALSELTNEGVKNLSDPEIKDKKIDRVFLIFASPWYSAKTKTTIIKKGAPVTFDKKMVNSIIKTEMDKFALSEGDKNEPTLIEHQIIDIKLNGYALANPYQKKARQIEMSLFMSFASTDLIQEIKKLVEGFFHTDNIEFHSFALSSYSFIRDHFEGVSNYLIVDVSSEITDIFVAEENKLTNSTSFPFGTRSIVRLLTSRFNISFQEALSILRLFKAGDLHEAESAKLEEALGDAETEWRKLFDKALEDVGNNSSVEKVFVISETDFGGILKDFILSDDKGTEEGLGVGFEEKKVTLIKPAFFKGLIDMPSGGDSFIASEAYYADKLSKLNTT